MTLDRSAVKENAKQLIHKNYWMCVLASFILMICLADTFGAASSGSRINISATQPVLTIPTFTDILSLMTSSAFFYGATISLFIGFFFSVFVGNPMEYGARNWFACHVKGTDSQDVLFSGFRKNQWIRISAMLLWRSLMVFLWSLLLVVPGVVKSYQYKFVPYILAEHPMMNTSDVMKYSSNLTNGHKMELFVLDLSFIGWFIVSALTLNLAGLFYVGPYFYQTQSLAYLEIRDAAKSSNR